ncbi:MULTISPECIES: hypothetical protein [Halorussus]|uniref:hypothetical protein n=1 Tax=Halorussus TaxID=1070314 RepID=UPI00209F2E2A|nr:hypothetical protein [Halorussus vallis]USZ74669.1 hypothetical protein NGM07_14635 [Halorussus vallis]
MAPGQGRRRRWLSLHNATLDVGRFTFDVEDSPVGGTVVVPRDELHNVFEAERGETYSVSVAADDFGPKEYEWEVADGTESLVAELTEEGVTFKEMNLL